MKKAFQSVVSLVFCFVLLLSTAVYSSAIGAVKSLKATSVTYNSATLTWSKVKNADGYQVRPYVDKKYGSIVDNKKTTTYKAKLTPGKSYTFYVRSYDKKLKGFKTVYEYSSWAKVAVKALPTQVKSLKGTQSGSSVKLTWNKVAGATGYTVQQYVSKKWKTIKTVTANSYTVTKQKYQTTQQFRVCAYSTYKKKNYAGPYSATVKVTLATPAPAKVSSLKATQSAKSVKLTWKAISGVKGYEVQQYVSKKWKTIKTVTTNSYTVTNQAYQSTQQFRVRAYKMYDKIRVNGSYSSTVKITIATPAPAKVSSLKATQSAKNVTLTWKAVSGAAGYEVQQYVSGKWKTIKTLSSTSHKVTNQAYQSTQQFRVRAYKMYDKIKVTGSYSSTVSITIATPAPAAVTNFKAAQSGNSVNLTWTAVSGAAGYTVQQYKSSKWTTIKTLTGTSHTVSSLTYGSTYKFRVCAYKMYDDIKSSSAYSEASVTITVAKPTSFKLDSVSTTTAKLKWTAKTGATGYEVYNYSTGKTTTVTTNSISLSSLKAGTSYKFKVRSYAGSYKSAYTSDLSFITVPAAVSNFKAVDVTDTTAKISWTGATGCTSYQLEKSEDAGKTWTNCSNSANTSVALSSLKSNTAYKFRVRGYLKDGSTTRYGAWSSELSVKTKLPAPTLSTSGNSEYSLNLSWTTVNGASKYVLENYNEITSAWYKVAEITGKTTYTDSTSEGKVKLYRVYALSDDATAGMPSNGVYSAPSNITISNTNYAATVTWGDYENTSEISAYEIKTKTKGMTNWRTIEIITTNDLDTYTVALTPGTINAYEISAYYKSGTVSRVLICAIDVSELVIDSTDASKNAQLLFLADAINKTKSESTKVTATLNSETKMVCDVLKIGGPLAGALTLVKPSVLTYYSLKEDAFILDTPEKITKFMSILDENSSAEDFNTTEKVKETHTFESGKEKIEGKKTVYLNQFLEPSTSYAYIYNQNNPTTWKNGFSAVSTVKNSDGTYTVNATIKAEKFGNGTSNAKAFYHCGFTPSFDSLDLGNMLGSSGETTTVATVGATNITAKITADGKLISYSTDSPLKMNMNASMSITDEEGGSSALTFATQMSGRITYNYTFTR